MMFVCAAAVGVLFGLLGHAEESDATALMLLSSEGVRTGLVLHIECGDGALTAALHRNGARIVHGITSDRSAVEAVRRRIRVQGVYGPVAAAHCDMKQLPYADGIANMIVVEDYATLSAKGVDIKEIMRVLAPYGTAFLKGFEGKVAGAGVSRTGQWTKVSKPRQPGTDEWTHFEHGPDRTSVSQDTAFRVPTGLRWVSGMFYPYSMLNVAFASTAGRNFYWYWTHHPGRYGVLKEQGKIVCRDAFSGVMLWERPVAKPPHGASFVAIQDRLYVQLGASEGLVALDAATGKQVLSFKEAKGHPLSEILVKDGVLVQSAGGVRAFDTATGALLWEQPNPLTVTDMILIGGRQVYYLHREDAKAPTFLIRCDLKSGEEQWRTELKMEFAASKFTKAVALLSYHRDTLLLANTSRMEFSTPLGVLRAVSSKDGSLLWEYNYKVVGHKGAPIDIFPMRDEVLVKTQNPNRTVNGKYAVLDLATGNEKRTINVGYNRCYPDRASTRFLLTGGFDFVDVAEGATQGTSAVRGHCNTGFMVAHGLTYAFPVRCTCFNLVRGFLGLAATGPTPTAEREDPVPVKGSAYGVQASDAADAANWPAFRHDGQRSNSTDVAVPVNIESQWTAKLGGRLSSLTASQGEVFVSSIDDHRVIAVDADSGKESWSFTAGGRVDSPPTLYKGVALFGSADGHVYCVRVADGELVWRLQAAPAARSIAVRGQMESLWRVPGSILVSDDTLYFAAGRNTQLDGGLHYYAADPLTGRVKWKKSIARQIEESTNDVLQRSAKTIHLGHRVHFAPEDGKIARHRGGGDKVFFAPLGLLVDCLTNGPVAREDIMRRQWGYGAVNAMGRMRSAFRDRGRFGVIAVDDGTVYGVTEDHEFNYEKKRIWARMLSIHRVPRGDDKGWAVKIDASLLMRALVATKEKLVLAVQLDGKPGGELWLLSKADGRRLATIQIDGVPRWDGLAVTDGKLFVATAEGRVLCFGAE
jgi:outer membrane protein assembly factor BamB